MEFVSVRVGALYGLQQTDVVHVNTVIPISQCLISGVVESYPEEEAIFLIYEVILQFIGHAQALSDIFDVCLVWNWIYTALKYLNNNMISSFRTL